MVRETRLAEIVEHRRLVLPQLSAPGVAAHKVKEACGFRVTFGPVRAADLPAFLAAGMKADECDARGHLHVRERAVRRAGSALGRLGSPHAPRLCWHPRSVFGDRSRRVSRCAAASARAARSIGAAWLALLAGGAVTPLALPWLPGRAFSLKGALAGGVLAAAADRDARSPALPAAKLALLAGVPAASSYTAMDFTGSTPITSPSGVEARDAQSAASAGRGGCRGSRRLAGQQAGKVSGAKAALHRRGRHPATRRQPLQRLRHVRRRLPARCLRHRSTAGPHSRTGAPAWSAAHAPSTASPGRSAWSPASAARRRSSTGG